MVKRQTCATPPPKTSASPYLSLPAVTHDVADPSGDNAWRAWGRTSSCNAASRKSYPTRSPRGSLSGSVRPCSEAPRMRDLATCTYLAGYRNGRKGACASRFVHSLQSKAHYFAKEISLLTHRLLFITKMKPQKTLTLKIISHE